MWFILWSHRESLACQSDWPDNRVLSDERTNQETPSEQPKKCSRHPDVIVYANDARDSGEWEAKGIAEGFSFYWF